MRSPRELPSQRLNTLFTRSIAEHFCVVDHKPLPGAQHHGPPPASAPSGSSVLAGRENRIGFRARPRSLSVEIFRMLSCVPAKNSAAPRHPRLYRRSIIFGERLAGPMVHTILGDGIHASLTALF